MAKLANRLDGQLGLWQLVTMLSLRWSNDSILHSGRSGIVHWISAGIYPVFSLSSSHSDIQ